ncbi:hypothetical protein ACQPZX_41205 [Actinoplanes sp. CA-142083]|uniref:hypothetical protein n=1 Tax=Actinoplanes sp. CA-142083 TaxID=3239903 RepID=UPI003D93CBA3
MREIRGREAALAVLNDPRFVVPPVPPVPPAAAGIGWLRATVGRFATGEDHRRRRALAATIIASLTLTPASAGKPAPASAGEWAQMSAGERVQVSAGERVQVSAGERVQVSAGERVQVSAGDEHPVDVLARAMGIDGPVSDVVRDIAQAYQPGTGDAARADEAVERLIVRLGGAHDEATAAHIGVLVQACDATATLRQRTRDRPLDEVLRDDPPVRATKRQATEAVTIDGERFEAGEVVLVPLAGDLAFGAGPRRCPGEELALALARA